MVTTAEGTVPLRPDLATLPAEISLLLRTAAHTHGSPAAHAYASAAITAWWSGDGATANLATDAALTADPTNRLAGLISLTLKANIPPAWVTTTD